MIVAAMSCSALPACLQAAALPAKALSLNREGVAALSSGDLQTAEARFALALEYNVRFTEAWVNLGLVELGRGNFERAGRDFVKARDLNPDLPTPHHALGLLADRLGDTEQAEAHYRAALRVDPGFAPGRVNLARLLFERGATEEAREQFLRVTQVAPERVEGWAGLAESLLRLGRADQAAAVLGQGIRRLGRQPLLGLVEGRLLLRTGAFREAVARLQPLTGDRDRPVRSAALAWLAIARLEQGDLQSATEAAQHAIQLDPDSPVARYAVAAVGGAFARNTSLGPVDGAGKER